MNISNKAALTSQKMHTQRQVCLSSIGCIEVHSKAGMLMSAQDLDDHTDSCEN
jgi:hypothetical protein